MIDHTMKMKHCDMPMQRKGSLPIRTPTPVTGSVAETLRKFISSNSTDTLPNVKRHNSVDSYPKTTKSQDARQKPKEKQVAFDIKCGIKDMIKDSGFYPNQINVRNARSNSNENLTPKSKV